MSEKRDYEVGYGRPPVNRRFKRDYEVGYGKPPVDRRFKPGQSGNPKGRPKRRPPSAEDVHAVFGGDIPVRKGGRTQKMNPFEVSLRRLAERAIRGQNLTAALAFLKLCQKHKVVSELVTKPYCGVLVVPKNWRWDAWMEMLGEHGAPPWPGPYSGLVGEPGPPNEEETKE